MRNDARAITAYVGAYTRRESFVDGKGEGIYAFSVDPTSGSMTYRAVTRRIINPSFLALAPGLRRLYAVSEIGSQAGEQGLVSAFSINHDTGELAYLNSQPSFGSAPCHLTVAGGQRLVLVANYVSGTLCALPILEDGQLGEATDVVQFEGSGPHPRQEGPHAHMVLPGPDSRFIYALDLGSDRILIYRLDAERGKLSPADPPWTALNPGAGPRHLVFHPDGRFAYTINELDSTVSMLHHNATNGSLHLQQSITTLPADFAGNYRGGDNLTAEIQVAPSGRFLYGSNRGHDSIVIYTIDQTNGHLSLVGHESTRGVGPRHFIIDPSETFLWAANQDSDTVHLFQIDPQSGRLTHMDQTVDVPTPVCIQLLIH